MSTNLRETLAAARNFHEARDTVRRSANDLPEVAALAKRCVDMTGSITGAIEAALKSVQSITSDDPGITAAKAKLDLASAYLGDSLGKLGAVNMGLDKAREAASAAANALDGIK